MPSQGLLGWSLSSGAHPRDPVARNDGKNITLENSFPAFAEHDDRRVDATRLSQIPAESLNAFAGVLKIGILGRV
jgi:hypothetical protein